MEDEDDSILNEFLVECSEGIERLDQEFVALEQDPEDEDLIGSIFRTIHTIKGTCGFLGLPKLENVAHGAENILSAMREHDIPVSSDGITILLDAVDVIKEILEFIESDQEEPDKDYGPVRVTLDAFLSSQEGDGDDAAPPTAEELALMAGMTIEGEDAVSEDSVGMPESLSEIQNEDEADLTPKIDAPTAEELAMMAAMSIQGEEVVDDFASAPAQTVSEALAAASSDAVPENPKKDHKEKKKKKRSIAESTIRVDVELLDKLINMVGELVLARNQLLQQVREREGASASDTSNGTVQQINLITTELQDTVMKTRMQPIKNVWDKFPRVVRDLALSNGKDVELVMEGAETELDKTLLEAIKDPMTHIVRNAADHGIEMPDIRAGRGKPAKGRLLLKAYHESGQINIEISDDGAGINVARVKQKAIEKGVITAEHAAVMSEKEALNLIFHPGLSTAEKVTNVSGRGVGMDVVKTNIETIGGTITLSSELGVGTHMQIEIPLTLAIIPALMVTSGGEPFSIPQASLLELVRVDQETKHQIEVIRGADFYRLRGVLLPLLSLNKVLGLKKKTEDKNQKKRLKRKPRSTGTNIVVLKAGAHSFGLVVDFVNDSEEIVVKPLSRQLRNLSYLAGATILGDGRVALILDVMGVAQAGGLLGADRNHSGDSIMEDVATTEYDVDAETVILFSMDGKDRYAIPLSQVARLEEFEINKIENSAGSEVIQYRDGLLPLVNMADVLGVMASSEEVERIPAIVFSQNGKSVGTLVGEIIDIVEVEMKLHPLPQQKAGVRGSLVIDGTTTDLLDISELLECSVPGWIEEVVV